MREDKRNTNPKTKVLIGAGVFFIALAFIPIVMMESADPLWYKIVLFFVTAAVIATVTTLGIARIEQYKRKD